MEETGWSGDVTGNYIKLVLRIITYYKKTAERNQRLRSKGDRVHAISVISVFHWNTGYGHIYETFKKNKFSFTVQSDESDGNDTFFYRVGFTQTEGGNRAEPNTAG